MNIKVKNITNANGNKVANQFEIIGDKFTIFQSYNSTIAIVKQEEWRNKVYLDEWAWDYSRTTLKHLYNFLGQWGFDLNKKKVLKLIERGEFILTDLNEE
tara:strand:- start:1707 stop:2006 length:300 start_codon:yes stop_codon:yes gene_type:complete